MSHYTKPQPKGNLTEKHLYAANRKRAGDAAERVLAATMDFYKETGRFPSNRELALKAKACQKTVAKVLAAAGSDLVLSIRLFILYRDLISTSTISPPALVKSKGQLQYEADVFESAIWRQKFASLSSKAAS
jgi:hypothetical protein